MVVASPSSIDVPARKPNSVAARETSEHLYAEAANEFVFLNSTDRQWDTRILFDMIPLTTDYDIIIASRRHKHYSYVLTFVSWLFNFVPRIFFGVSTHDAGAVKLMRREVIVRFPAVSKSPFNEAERLIKAVRAGYHIRDFPVDIKPRTAGKARGVTFRSVTAAVADVVRVWRDLQ
jgi:hypothetical protein